MKKILYVITGLGMGGAERQVCDLADKLTHLGYQVKIAYLLKPVVTQPKSEEVELVWLGGDKSPLKMFKALKILIRLIRQEQPDVIHSHMFHANILARLAKMFFQPARLICTAHSSNEGGALRMLAYRLTNHLADVFTNVSQKAVIVFEDKKAAPAGKMLATHNGINTDLFQFNETSRMTIRREHNLDAKKVFIAIGRFHEAKDYPNLINAFYTINKTHSNTHLLIVGDGELRSEIETSILSKGLTNSITLLGIRNDIAGLLSAADIFVLSSAYEGFGLVVAEAMSCERVVIATDSGGVAEVLGNEGFLVQPKDSNELTLAMQKALSLNEEEAGALGISARTRIVNNYSLNSVVDGWLKIYQSKY